MEPVIDAELAQISRRIRRWREAGELTLHELAARSGVATSTIQKVETAQMIPSIAVLLKIARGLGRRLSELIHDGVDQVDVVHLPAGERHSLGRRSRLLVERLSGDLSSAAIEAWRITLHPGISCGREPILYDGEELVICEEGEVTFRVGETDYELRAGDTLHFRASIPHTWRNESKSIAVFAIVGTLPEVFRAKIQGRVAAAVRVGSA